MGLKPDIINNNGSSAFRFEELFDIGEIQKIQDSFSEATGVASLITRPDGTPITRPSNFCRLCTEIRRTEMGLKNCHKSDSVLGSPNEDGPIVQRCLSGSLMDAGASIIVKGQHIANWLIGQVLDEDEPAENLLNYADTIGMDREIFRRELSHVKRMSKSQFESISRFLYLNAHFLSESALKSLELSNENRSSIQREIEIKRLNNQLIHDLNERKLVEQALRQSEDGFRTVFDSAPMGIGVFDLLTRKTHQVNAKYAEVVGRTQEKMLEIDWTEITHPEDVEDDLYDTEYLFANPGKGIKRHKRYIRPDGTIVWANLTVVSLKAEDGVHHMEITMMEDATDQKRREEEIHYLNYHDILTKLHNRAYIEKVQKSLEAENQLPLSVIMGDINGLKLINDAFGHQAGDKLLVEIAEILRRCCRKEDIIARIGGDEFLILMPKTDVETARCICDCIHEECDRFIADDDKNIFHPSIALGSATKTQSSELIEKTIKNAEEIMYRRKLLDRKSMHSSLIASIKATMFEKSHETEAHAERLVILSKQIGQELNLSTNEMNELDLLATLHDIGKISVDDYILRKPGMLNAEEWAEIKKHPEAGYRIALASPELNEIADFILCHHEHWNGNGYPQGLKGDAIPLLSRIISVVDAYDAMTQERSYKPTISMEAAIEEIRKNSGTQFDPTIAVIFVDKVLLMGES